MESDQTLKILKMVQEGFLTPEQGQRLIAELNQTQSKASGPENGPKTPSSNAEADLFKLVENAGKTIGEGFERLFQFAGATVKGTMGLGPQNIVVKVLDLEGTIERYQVTIPLKIFLALKPLLIVRSPLVVHPIQQVDYDAIFRSLESGETGKVFEYLDHERGDRLEVWVV